MSAAVRLWRAGPVRGPGSLVAAHMHRRAKRGELVATGPFGAKYLIDPANPPEASIYLWGTYEPEVVSALGRLLRSGDAAIDIGANCGVLSVIMSRLVGPGGKVVALDPSPRACERIRPQAHLNGTENIEVRDVALGAAARQEVYRMGRVGIGALPDVDAEYTTGGVIHTHVATVVEIAASLEGRVALIKIDTDGSEVSILRGAADVLSRDRPAIVMETYLAGLSRHGASAGELAELLLEHEYELFVPNVARRRFWRASPPPLQAFVPAPVSDLADGRVDEVNVVAISRRDDGARARRVLLGA